MVTAPDSSEQDVLRVERLTKHFTVKQRFLESFRRDRTRVILHAVDNVTFSVRRGEIVGLVGESGCGKTTTGRLITLLETRDAGMVYYEGKDVATLSLSELREFRRRVQIIFQNPYDSLDPKFTVYEILEEPLLTHRIGKSKSERNEIVRKMLLKIGIPLDLMNSYPTRLSGGQRQRIALARIFMLDPKLVIADEPVSMLDASVRASILNMLVEMRERIGTAVILITHDLAIARHICDRICVMYLGELVEIASSDEIVRFPLHPYTRALLSAIPRPNPDQPVSIDLTGEIGSAINPPSACRLNPRCPHAYERCRTEAPQLREIFPGHYAACHRSEELLNPTQVEQLMEKGSKAVHDFA